MAFIHNIRCMWPESVGTYDSTDLLSISTRDTEYMTDAKLSKCSPFIVVSTVSNSVRKTVIPLKFLKFNNCSRSIYSSLTTKTNFYKFSLASFPNSSCTRYSFMLSNCYQITNSSFGKELKYKTMKLAYTCSRKGTN